MTVQVSEFQLAGKTPRIGVVIPVYGDSDSICSVLHRFRKGSVNTICLVVDVPLRRDMDKIREAARQGGITVHIIKNRHRTGVGSSLRQGLRYLAGTEHDIAVVMAGNGKDDPAEIIRVIEPVVEDECDYVQGSRYLPGGKKSRMPFVRVVFNRLYPLIWSMVTQRRCTDVTNGFRCYTLNVLRDHRVNLDQAWLDGYSLEYYLHYKVLALAYRFKEVPVTKTYPFGNRGGYSKIQPLKDWWPIISPLILLFLGVRK
ncbi:MAG: glycosyltransferase family 2 protein [Candidatus Bathyarchaeia archaeon]|jgi:dolichol-phosphate mannosyltransferase